MKGFAAVQLLSGLMPGCRWGNMAPRARELRSQSLQSSKGSQDSSRKLLQISPWQWVGCLACTGHMLDLLVQTAYNIRFELCRMQQQQ